MSRSTFTHRYPLKYILVWLLFVFAVGVLLFAILGSAGAQDNQSFDHSACQYPGRTTNPAGGCDNSDPCDPASAVKGGTGDCPDVSKSQAEPVSQNVKTGDNPVETEYKSCAQ